MKNYHSNHIFVMYRLKSTAAFWGYSCRNNVGEPSTKEYVVFHKNGVGHHIVGI
jgi:hypothetical protein